MLLAFSAFCIFVTCMLCVCVCACTIKVHVFCFVFACQPYNQSLSKTSMGDCQAKKMVLHWLTLTRAVFFSSVVLFLSALLLMLSLAQNVSDYNTNSAIHFHLTPALYSAPTKRPSPVKRRISSWRLARHSGAAERELVEGRQGWGHQCATDDKRLTQWTPRLMVIACSGRGWEEASWHSEIGLYVVYVNHYIRWMRHDVSRALGSSFIVKLN